MSIQQGGPPAEHQAGGRATTRLEPLVAKVVAALGFQLDSLDLHQAGRRRLVKLVVDAGDESSHAGVGLDDIAEISRAVSAALDDQDAIVDGPYTLEVTSPGAGRPLTRPRHWRRARQRLVKLRRVDGGQHTVRVGDCDESGVRLLIDGEPRRVPYDEIAHAVIEVEFRPPPADELARLDGPLREES